MAKLNKKALADHFDIDPRTLNKFHELWIEQIGPYIGRCWTPRQIKTWFRLFSAEGIAEKGSAS